MISGALWAQLPDLDRGCARMQPFLPSLRMVRSVCAQQPTLRSYHLSEREGSCTGDRWGNHIAPVLIPTSNQFAARLTKKSPSEEMGSEKIFTAIACMHAVFPITPSLSSWKELLDRVQQRELIPSGRWCLISEYAATSVFRSRSQTAARHSCHYTRVLNVHTNDMYSRVRHMPGRASSASSRPAMATCWSCRP